MNEANDVQEETIEKSPVGKMLADGIVSLAEQNKIYIEKRDSAKTQFKKDYYDRKIKKTSEKAERLLRGLSLLPSRKKSTTKSSGPK